MPATTTEAILPAPVLACTLSLTRPVPVPAEGLSAIHAAGEFAVQLQPAVVFTSTNRSEASGSTLSNLVGVTSKTHGPVFGDGYQEQMIIDADTGVPVTFIGGDPSHPSVTVTYDVKRVATSDLTQGG